MIRTIVSVAFSRGLGGLAQAIILILLVREMGPVSFGQYTFITVRAGLVATFSGLGMNTLALRISTKSEPESWARQIVRLRNISIIVFMLVLIAVLKLVNISYMSTALIAILFTLFETSSTTLEAVLFGLQKTKAAQISLVVRRVLVLAGLSVSLLFGLDIVLALAVGLVFGLLSSIFWTRKLTGQVVRKLVILREAFPYWVPSLLAQASNLDAIIAKSVLPSHSFGVFAAGSRAVNTFQLLPSSFLAVFTPTLTRIKTGQQRFAFASRILRYFLLGALTIITCSFAIAKIVHFAIGPEYIGIFPVLVVLIITFSIDCVSQVLVSYFYADAKPSCVSTATLVATCFGLAMIFVLANSYDAVGAAVGLLIMRLTRFAFLLAFFVHIHRSLKRG